MRDPAPSNPRPRGPLSCIEISLFLYRKLTQYPVGHTLYSIHAGYSQGWMGVERGSSTFVQRKGGCGEKTGYARAASSHHCRASFCLALVAWRTTSAHIHGKRPPSRLFICLHAWSCQCFTHCASSQAAPFTGGCSIACPSRYFPSVFRPQGGNASLRPCSPRDGPL